MRKRVLYYAIKYSGDYNNIKRAIENNEYYKIVKTNSKYLTIYDQPYPNSLLQLKRPPFILFYKGDISLLNYPAVSIVGSRKMTFYGSKYTKVLTQKLKKDRVIVSGMAAGIDAVAHLEAVTKGKTIAVLGCGINYIYPKSNTNLYNNLSLNHLIVSEYPDTLPPKPYFFPFRNRIIAALGESVYVMQASLRSGTMLTVNEALELNKSIYVLPYRIDDSEGFGCNYLIQQGANVILIDDL